MAEPAPDLERLMDLVDELEAGVKARALERGHQGGVSAAGPLFATVRRMIVYIEDPDATGASTDWLKSSDEVADEQRRRGEKG